MTNKMAVGYEFSSDRSKAEIEVSSPHDLPGDWVSPDQTQVYISFENIEEHIRGDTHFNEITRAKTIASASKQFLAPELARSNPEVHLDHKKSRSKQKSLVSNKEARKRAEYFGTLLTKWSVTSSKEDLADELVSAEFEVTPEQAEDDLDRLRASLKSGNIPEEVVDTITEKIVSEQLGFIREVTGDDTTGDREGAKEVLKEILQNEN